MEQESLQKAAKKAYRHTLELIMRGEIPVYLGESGLLALMHNSIKEYHASPNNTSLLNLSSYALCALAIKMEEEEWDELSSAAAGEDHQRENIDMPTDTSIDSPPPASDPIIEPCPFCSSPVDVKEMSRHLSGCAKAQTSGVTAIAPGEAMPTKDNDES